MDPVSKAIALRKSFPLKAKDPFWAFQGRMRMPRRILATIEKSKNPIAVFYEARRWFIVALCAAYELYWRDFVRISLDAHPPSPTRLRELRKHKFSLKDLHFILGSRLTISELISAAYVFQSTDVLNCVAHDVFDLDLFGGFAKKKFKITVDIYDKRGKNPESISHTIVTGEKVLKNRTLIDQAFSIRHETVHDTGMRFRPSRHKIAEIESSMLEFNTLLSFHWEELFESEIRKKKL